MPHRALDYGSLPGPSRSRGRTPSAASAASHHVHIPLIPASAPPALFLARIGLRGGRLMMFVTLFASLGVLLFGYDQGVMSSLLVHPAFKHYFHDPNAAQIGTVVAILDIGALITSLLAGTLADRIGRKATIFWGAILLSIGGFLQTAALHLEMLTVGRIVAGFGIGFLTMIVPTYQSEISVAEHRGYLASIEYTLNISGYALSVWVGYGASFMTGDVSWRFPLSIQVVVGLILAVGSLFLPESPRYLLDKDRDLDAMRVLVELHSNKSDQHNKRARLEYREIKENVLFLREQGDRSYRAMWKRYRYRVLVACSSQLFAQMNGINVVSYYAPLLFAKAGWKGRDAVLMTGINSCLYVTSTIPVWFLIDSWGRRPILVYGGLAEAFFLFLTGLFLWLDLPSSPQLVVVSIIFYTFSFGASFGPVPWLLPPEIMPLAFRAKGVSLSTATNWLSNYYVGETTPIYQDLFGWRLYPMHGMFCLIAVLCVYTFYPETAGVPIEEMGIVFGDEYTSHIPQESSDDEDESAPFTHPPRQIRRSISSHPRFSTDSQGAAAEARAVAAAHTAELQAQAGRSWRRFVPFVSNGPKYTLVQPEPPAHPGPSR